KDGEIEIFPSKIVDETKDKIRLRVTDDRSVVCCSERPITTYILVKPISSFWCSATGKLTFCSLFSELQNAVGYCSVKGSQGLPYLNNVIATDVLRSSLTNC